MEELIHETQQKFLKDSAEMEARLLECLHNISVKPPRHLPSPQISYHSINDSCPRRQSQLFGHSSTTGRSPRGFFVEPQKPSTMPDQISSKRRKKEAKDKSFAEVTSFRKNLMKQMLTMSK